MFYEMSQWILEFLRQIWLSWLQKCDKERAKSLKERLDVKDTKSEYILERIRFWEFL